MPASVVNKMAYNSLQLPEGGNKCSEAARHRFWVGAVMRWALSLKSQVIVKF
jgi:hypothetical protein